MQLKPLIAANWKMNGSVHLVDAMLAALTRSDIQVDVLICPPATLLPVFAAKTTLALGGQDISSHDSGAYTGQLSAELLKEAGATYSLIGHSERRQYQFESDELIAQKVMSAIAQGVTPVLCIGETLAQREQEKTEQVLAKQLAKVYAAHPELLQHTVIAYEPVWAIGTGVSATPEQAQQAHAFIRQQLAAFDASAAATVRILYGGSVTAENSSALFTQPDINGALVGGASLKPDDFVKICQSAQG